MPFAEDLTVFFRPDDFGTAATYTSSAPGSEAATVNGIFREPYGEALAGLVAGNAPTFTCVADDVPDVAQGDTLAIGAASYKVRGIEPDGTGVVRLVLERQ